MGSLLAALLFLAAVTGCSTEPTARILFIGNSYTHSNDLPGVVRDLAASAGHTIEVETRAPGGWWLRDHLASSETLDAIAEGDFDFVVLQEQSMAPALHNLAERVSRPAARALATRAVQSGADVVYFMTWGHRDGSDEVGHSSYGPMQIAIADTYDRFATATISEVAPVGAAWWMSLDELSEVGLYQPDGSHPAPAGTYLAGAVIAGTILDIDPTEFETDLGVSPENAEALRSFAARAVSGERPWE